MIGSRRIDKASRIGMQSSGFDKLHMTDFLMPAGKKPVSCQLCGKNYANQSNVNRHIKRDHSTCPHLTAAPVREEPLLPFITVEAPARPSSLVSCQFCGKRYANQSSVNRHVKKDHCTHPASSAAHDREESLLPSTTDTTTASPLCVVQPRPRVYILKSSENKHVFIGCKSAPLGCHTYCGLRNTVLTTANFASILKPTMPAGSQLAGPFSNSTRGFVKIQPASYPLADGCPEKAPMMSDILMDTGKIPRKDFAAAVDVSTVQAASAEKRPEPESCRSAVLVKAAPVKDHAETLLQTTDNPLALSDNSQSPELPTSPHPPQQHDRSRSRVRQYKPPPTLRSRQRMLQRRQRATFRAAVKVNAGKGEAVSHQTKGDACLSMYLALRRHAPAKNLFYYFRQFPMPAKKERAILSVIEPADLVHSVANKVRSLRYLYSGKRVLSQTQYQDIINANKEDNGSGFVRPIPYKALIKEIEQLEPDEAKIQELPVIEGEAPVHGGRKSLKVLLCQIADSLLKMDEIEPGFVNRQWDMDGAFVMGYTVGGDACPAGAKKLTSYLVTPVNVMRHVSSSKHCHLLIVGECEEESPVLLKLNEDLSAEIEEIDGKRFDLGGGRFVIFKCFGLVGDQKFIATVSGELNNAFRFPSPYVDVNFSTLDNTRWKVVDDASIKEAFHRWTYEMKLLGLEKTNALAKSGASRKDLRDDMNARRTRTETRPSISAFLHERIMPDPLHTSILGWREWFHRLLFIVCDLTFDVQIARFKSSRFGKKPLCEVMELHPDIPLVMLVKLLRDIDSSLFRKIERNFNYNGLVSQISFKGKDARTLSSHYGKICDLLVSIVTRSEDAAVATSEPQSAADDASSAAPAPKKVKLTGVSSNASAKCAVSKAATKKATAAEKKAAAIAEAEALRAAKRAAKLFHPYQRCRVIGLFYSAKMLQKCCAIYFSIKLTPRKLTGLEIFGERFYAAARIMGSNAKPIHVHVGRVIPYYARRVFSQYGLGLGAMDLNGREANHQLLKYQSLHAGTSSGDPHKHWQRVFEHDYVRKIHLPLLRRKLTKVNPRCLNYTPCFPKGPGPFCDCGLPKITGLCKLCDSSEFDMLRRSAQQHKSVSELAVLSKSYEDIYGSTTKDASKLEEELDEEVGEG